MKKITMLAAMLAMVLVVAAPAIAQVEQGFDQETDSGDVDQTFTVTGGGSNGSSCTPLSGTSQTGNVQDSNGSVRFDQDNDGDGRRDRNNGGEIDQEDIGSDLTVSSDGSTECKQEVNQAAAAGSPKVAPAPAPKVAPTPAPKVAPAPAPKAAPAPAPAPAPKAEVKAETPEAKAAAPAPAPKAEVKAETPEAKAPAPKMEEKKKEEKELPKTGGGTASLLALGAGALLVGGGLLARRMTK